MACLVLPHTIVPSLAIGAGRLSRSTLVSGERARVGGAEAKDGVLVLATPKLLRASNGFAG